jgi:hypothetical protein
MVRLNQAGRPRVVQGVGRIKRYCGTSGSRQSQVYK